MGDSKKERKTAERMTILSHYTKVTSYFLYRVTELKFSKLFFFFCFLTTTSICLTLHLP